MNIHLADSLEEFDIRYIESCNQCFAYKDNTAANTTTNPEEPNDNDNETNDAVSDMSRPKARSDSIATKTGKLTLSSPLLDHNEFGKERFSIYGTSASASASCAGAGRGPGPTSNSFTAASSTNSNPNSTNSTNSHTNSNTSFTASTSGTTGSTASTGGAGTGARRPPLRPSLTTGSYKKNRNLGNPFYKPPSFSSTSIMTINDLESPTKKRKVSFNHSVSSFESLLSLHKEFHESQPQPNDDTKLESSFTDDDENYNYYE